MLVMAVAFSKSSITSTPDGIFQPLKSNNSAERILGPPTSTCRIIGVDIVLDEDNSNLTFTVG